MTQLDYEILEDLFDAITNNDLNTVKQYVESKIDIHCSDDHALRWACCLDRLNIVKYLIKQGANIHALDDQALRNACFNGQLNIVKFLIKQGANIHVENDLTLKYAHTRDCTTIVKYLLSLEPSMYWLTHNNREVRKIYKEYNQ